MDLSQFLSFLGEAHRLRNSTLECLQHLDQRIAPLVTLQFEMVFDWHTSQTTDQFLSSFEDTPNFGDTPPELRLQIMYLIYEMAQNRLTLEEVIYQLDLLYDGEGPQIEEIFEEGEEPEMEEEEDYGDRVENNEFDESKESDQSKPVDGLVEQIYDEALVSLEEAHASTCGAAQQVSPPSLPPCELTQIETNLATSHRFHQLQQNFITEGNFEELFQTPEYRPLLSPEEFERAPGEESLDELIQTDAARVPEVQVSPISENADNSRMDAQETLQTITEERKVAVNPVRQRQPSSDSIIIISSDEDSDDENNFYYEEDFVDFSDYRKFSYYDESDDSYNPDDDDDSESTESDDSETDGSQDELELEIEKTLCIEQKQVHSVEHEPRDGAAGQAVSSGYSRAGDGEYSRGDGQNSSQQYQGQQQSQGQEHQQGGLSSDYGNSGYGKSSTGGGPIRRPKNRQQSTSGPY